MARRFLVVIAAFVCAVVLLTPEAASARSRRKAPPAPPKDAAAPVIEHVPPTSHTGTAPVVIKATIVDDSGVFEPTLVVRRPGGAYARVPMLPVADEPNVFVAEVPAELLDADLEYLIEAFDAQGNGPARAGSEDAPLPIRFDRPLAPETLPPVTPTAVDAPEEEGSNMPILIGAGVATGLVVLAGAGVALAVVLYTSREPDPTTTRVSVSGPAPVAALLARARGAR